MAPIQFTAPVVVGNVPNCVFLIPKHKWQSIHWPVWARSGQGLRLKRPQDIWSLCCQWRSSTPLYSPVSKGVISLEAVGEVEAGRAEQKRSPGSHPVVSTVARYSPLLSLSWPGNEPQPQACHGGALQGHQRCVCRKEYSQWGDLVQCSGGSQSKRTETGDILWDTIVKPYARKHANKITLTRWYWGHKGVNGKLAVENYRSID